MFVGTECPISNAFMPRLAELSKEYTPKGVQLLAINANRQDSPARVADHAKENRLPFPVLKDAGNRIADLFGAQRTPEAFLLDSKRVIRYHGRIDDQFGIGFKRSAPTRRDLAVALDELLAGKAVSQPETQPMGQSPHRQDQEGRRHLRPPGLRLSTECQECHGRPDHPMTLASYDVVAWSTPFARSCKKLPHAPLVCRSPPLRQ